MPISRDWTVSINNAFSSSSDQAIQYREALYNLKETLMDAGWAVKTSYRGAGSVSTGDTWTSASLLVYDVAGTGAWIVLENVGVYALLFTDNAAADTTPQLIGWRISTQDYTGGTTSALPTTIGTETGAYTSASLNLIPWTTATDGRWCSWYTDRGDVMFGIKPKVGTNFRYFFLFTSNEDADGGGVGGERWACWMRSSSTTDVLTSTNLKPVTYWRALRDNGAATADITAHAAVWDETVAPDHTGATLVRQIDLFHQQALWGRYLGQVVDVYANPSNATFNTLIEAGSPLSLRCIGDISVWVPGTIIIT